MRTPIKIPKKIIIENIKPLDSPASVERETNRPFLGKDESSQLDASQNKNSLNPQSLAPVESLF